MKRSGAIIVLSGPSGVGKSTLIAGVRREIPELEFSVSCTTRKPRPGERDGVDYYFLGDDEFAARVENGDFFEYAGVHGKRYGTLKSECVARSRRGVPVLLDIDVQGARSVRRCAAADPELQLLTEFVFVAPPSFGELERRLRGRGTESAGQLALRLEAAKGELANWREYDYLVVNDDVERSTRELIALVRAFSLKTRRIQEELFQ